MSAVTRYITETIGDDEVQELASAMGSKRFVLDELRELQTLMKCERTMNREKLLVQFNNLVRVWRYLANPNVYNFLANPPRS